MSGVRLLHFLRDWWKFIQIPQNYTMALTKLNCEQRHLQINKMGSKVVGADLCRHNTLCSKHSFHPSWGTHHKCVEAMTPWTWHIYHIVKPIKSGRKAPWKTNLCHGTVNIHSGVNSGCGIVAFCHMITEWSRAKLNKVLRNSIPIKSKNCISIYIVWPIG